MMAGSRASSRQTERIEVPEGDEAVWSLGAINRLCAIAAPLLVVAMRLHEASTPADLIATYEQALAAVRTFESAALNSGLSTERMKVARFLCCATIDDVATGSDLETLSHWPSQGLLGAIEEDPWGGERFLGAIEQALADPVGSIELLELAYLCFAIGFAGRYRVMPRGGGDLATLRDRLYRAIRRVRGEPDRPLSPMWRGLNLPYAPPRRSLPISAVFAGGLLLLAGLFTYFSLDLTWRAGRVSAQVQALFPAGQATVIRPTRPVPGAAQIERIRQALAGPLEAGQVQVGHDDRTILIRVASGGLFVSGLARISPAFIPVLDQIAAALAAEPGRIVVIGHTDDVPLRPTGTIVSNRALSQARADATAERLRAALGAGAGEDPGRVMAIGRGADEPLVSNATPEGRALNRRIEFLLPRSDASPP
jgi:type VI secretion system protein ImpK